MDLHFRGALIFLIFLSYRYRYHCRFFAESVLCVSVYVCVYVYVGGLDRFFFKYATNVTHRVVTMCGLAVVEAISESLTSMGMRSSYKVGAWRIIPAVPTITARVKIHRNNLSSTIATYFQSSLTWLEFETFQFIAIRRKNKNNFDTKTTRIWIFQFSRVQTRVVIVLLISKLFVYSLCKFFKINYFV